MTAGGETTTCYPLAGVAVDAARLRADLARVESAPWVTQDRYAKGVTNWTGLALYSVSGAADDLRCASRAIVKQTPAGALCPYVCEELLPQFGAPLLRVALYRLAAGTTIGEHRDYGENRTMGFVRIHVPVVTNDRVVMHLDGHAYRFAPGEAWYFDASCAHRVENGGVEDRIHLIVDLAPSGRLLGLLKALTAADRVRFFRHRLEFYGQVGATFVQFVRTREGRGRIRAKLAQVLGASA